MLCHCFAALPPLVFAHLLLPKVKKACIKESVLLVLSPLQGVSFSSLASDFSSYSCL